MIKGKTESVSCACKFKKRQKDHSLVTVMSPFKRENQKVSHEAKDMKQPGREVSC